MLQLVIGYSVVGLKVAVGLGFVIFVHELGHFIVAKLCGVKCEKFYLGFDIAGLKFCKFRRGETEYGIGILPLGGYVKMLGQEDNPARLREEMERAKAVAGDEGPGLGTSGPSEAAESSGFSVQNSSPTPPSNIQHPTSDISASQSPTPNSPLFDPRSFLAKSVPQRMAIISAGVIMNVFFAFVLAVAAFSLGVEELPCVIGGVFPGEAAWQADLRVGDEILEIAGKKMKKFRDLQTAITLGDIDAEHPEVPLLVSRPGVEQPFTVVVKPDRSRGAFFIGVDHPYTTRLIETRKTWLVQKREPVMPGSVADLAQPPFRNGDKLVKIDDVPVEDCAQLGFQLARKTDDEITVTVERAADESDGASTAETRPVSTAVARNHMRSLGLVMQMGPVTAVQVGSPAAAAGIVPGDVIRKIDGEPVADAMTLPGELRRRALRRAGEAVEVTIERAGAPVTVPVRLREPRGFFAPEIILYDRPEEAAALGVTYRVLNRVQNVIEGSPAAKAGVRPNDVIVTATLLPPDKEILRKLEVRQPEVLIPFTEKDHNWPALVCALQKTLPGTDVQLTLLRDKTELPPVRLQPVEDANWSNPDRGLLFEPMLFEQKAENVDEALALGGRATLDEMTVVFRSVKKLSTNQVSMRGLAGPWEIIKMAFYSADQGTARLLLFLTLLSANLAVINFLPIPVLDGGHMVFLLYEGVRGKPADERVQVVLTYLGLIFILALMVWVFGLDLGLISRR